MDFLLWGAVVYCYHVHCMDVAGVIIGASADGLLCRWPGVRWLNAYQGCVQDQGTRLL